MRAASNSILRQYSEYNVILSLRVLFAGKGTVTVLICVSPVGRITHLIFIFASGIGKTVGFVSSISIAVFSPFLTRTASFSAVTFIRLPVYTSCINSSTGVIIAVIRMIRERSSE